MHKRRYDRCRKYIQQPEKLKQKFNINQAKSLRREVTSVNWEVATCAFILLNEKVTKNEPVRWF